MPTGQSHSYYWDLSEIEIAIEIEIEIVMAWGLLPDLDLDFDFDNAIYLVSLCGAIASPLTKQRGI
jgi:hypothetical protein